ncbi:N-acetylglucosamine-6-phosphate deacetylase [Ruminococcaceae bacterium OttesenSCG-928-I18]|nr:N-acetylglucosamine-6-phosphate deacetylase [Ruminococcaceae bacterium OttesenSCG-928-I18]
MVITNGLVFTDECRFARLDLEYNEGRIIRLAPAGSLADQSSLDAEGGFVLPGFVDIHTHGCAGGDFSSATAEEMEKMLAFYGRRGVTSVIGTTMSLPPAALQRAMETAKPFCGADGRGATLRGLRLEGPFLSPGKKGAQKEEHLIPSLSPSSYELFEALYSASGEHVRILDIAPELPGGPAFIQKAARKTVVSLAHTEADYEQCAEAFKQGATHLTHLFNGMPPFHHRHPGPIGAASDYASFVELICDGVHLHPSVVRSVFQWFGESRICLVSDSMSATGMSPGRYTLGGQEVLLENEAATLADGTLAGSVSTLTECCRKAVHYGVPIEQAVRAATLNPAMAAGLVREVGTLTPGKRADILLWNQDLLNVHVIAGGETVFH